LEGQLLKTFEKIGNGALLVTEGPLKYIQFECLNEYSDILIHCMSTRVGGVSTGECSTLNLGFGRKDSRSNVISNFNSICAAVGLEPDSLVLTNQVHDTKVRLVDADDRGKGFSRQSDIKGIDGLYTMTPGVTLTTFHADCVPVFIFEPGIKAAALLHSGWRGTLSDITGNMARKLRELPGYESGRAIAVIGPSIGYCCFEVDDDVYFLFREKYNNDEYYRHMPNGKHNVDLKAIIAEQLADEGIEESHIHDCGICTKCRNDLFFSYRGDKGRTGSMAAFMQIKPQGASNEKSI
jgi:YfiH family protein